VLYNEHILVKYPESNIFSVLNEAECLIMQYIERCVTEEIIDYSPTQIDVTQDPFEVTWLKPLSPSALKPQRLSPLKSLLVKLSKFIKNFLIQTIRY
ncbi:MAG: hypothetical protein K2K97_05970, partial [Muribaculaceae bacterium]|nr:hypothetical protein [Muribaculaceae bacterium]